MKTTKKTPRVLLLATATSFALGACGGNGSNLPPPEEGNAYLTIVGDSNVFIDRGAQQRLMVRYHDSNDQPLAGKIMFEVVGSAQGSTISKDSGVTNSEGLVELNVNAGSQDTSFQIKATAPYASSAIWSIAVQNGDSVPPLEPQGTYRLNSQFDVSTLPGDVGNVVSDFVAMTDDPYDPATWVLDQIDGVPGFLRPGLDAVLNQVIEDNAPNFVNDILDVGDRLGQAAHKFGTVSELRVKGAGNDVDNASLTAVHTMTGFTFRIDGQTYDYTLADLGSQEPVVEGVSIQMDGDNMNVGAHDMPVNYGGFLGLALEDDIIPLVDPNASSLHEFFMDRVDCTNVGSSLYNQTQILSADFWKGACDIGLQAAAESIMAEIVGIDEQAPLLLKISGHAHVADSNGDRTVDEMSRGKWNGSLDFNGDSEDLVEPGSFTGERMSN